MKVSLILISILLAALTACAVKLLDWVWFRPKKLEKLLRQQGLNGNSYRLLVGDMKELIAEVKKEQFRPIQLSDSLPPHIFPHFYKLIAKYGENSFIWFGPWPRLMISDPHLMKEILAKPEIFHKPTPDPISETLAGGLLILEDDQWAKHRVSQHTQQQCLPSQQPSKEKAKVKLTQSPHKEEQAIDSATYEEEYCVSDALQTEGVRPLQTEGVKTNS